MRHRRSLSHAVALGDGNSRQSCETLSKIWREWSGAGFGPPHSVLLWKASFFCGATQGVHCGRNQGEDSDLLSFDESTKTLGIEARHQHQARAHNERWVQNHIQSVNVVHRQEIKDDVALAKSSEFAWSKKLIDVGDQILVGQHYALGQSGRAARIWKRRQLFRGHRGKMRKADLQEFGEGLCATCRLPDRED